MTERQSAVLTESQKEAFGWDATKTLLGGEVVRVSIICPEEGRGYSLEDFQAELTDEAPLTLYSTGRGVEKVEKQQISCSELPEYVTQIFEQQDRFDWETYEK